MREELNPVLAKRMLDEWRKICETKFWEHYTARLETEREKTKDDWEITETGTEAVPLFEKWLRLQGKAHAFRKALKIPVEILGELEKIVKGE